MSDEKTNDEKQKNNIFEGILPPDRLDGVNMNGCLWQTIEKEHMEMMSYDDDDEEISDDEWSLFVRMFQHAFANEISALAAEHWNERHINGMPKMGQ